MEFKCHWGLPNEFRAWENALSKSPAEIVELTKLLEKESWIYVHFPDTGNRIRIDYVSNGMVNVDLQYSDPICEGAVSLNSLLNILENYQQFQKNPEKFGVVHAE